jgi:cell division protein FtsB
MENSMKSLDNHPGAAQNIAMVLAVIAIVVLFFSIIVGDKGISSLQLIKIERQTLMSVSVELQRKNLQLFHEIERLKKDPLYVESIARQELGLIGNNEIVINMSNITATEKK